VRALTRVATPENEERLLTIAKSCTGAQLERLCRGLRRAIALTEDGDRPDDRRMVREEVVENGMVRLTAVLHADDAALPNRTNLDNGQCVPCGDNGQPCCNKGKLCPGTRQICFTPENRCIDCGGPDQGCCGPERTNNSPGGFPDQPGQCFEGSSCMPSGGTSPGFFCG
jgi:hypothetical protein